MMRVLLGLTAAALAAAPAASTDRTKDDAALARVTAGRTAGTPVDCIDRGRSDDFHVAGRHLIFRARARVAYVSELTPGCPTGSRQALVFRSISSRICRGEIAESVDLLGSAAGGSCTVGVFVPYERP